MEVRTVVRAPRQTVAKSRPSESFYAGLTGDRLFADDFGAAARRGVEIHERYRQVEWATDAELAALPAGFREAFARPSDAATVWRERSYELFADGAWETGQFDRVVFDGEGDARTATIYDFKTNAKGRDESDGAFAERLRKEYAAQIVAYRKALSRLTGIPSERIAAKLLAEATGQAVQVAQG